MSFSIQLMNLLDHFLWVISTVGILFIIIKFRWSGHLHVHETGHPIGSWSWCSLQIANRLIYIYQLSNDAHLNVFDWSKLNARLIIWKNIISSQISPVRFTFFFEFRCFYSCMTTGSVVNQFKYFLLAFCFFFSKVTKMLSKDKLNFEFG